MKALVLVVGLAAAAGAGEPVVVCDAAGCRPLKRRQVDAALADLKARPRDMRVVMFGREVFLDVTPDDCGRACRKAVLRSPDLGVQRTFEGPDSAAVIPQFLGFVRSEAFLMSLLGKLPPGALRWLLSALDAPAVVPDSASALLLEGAALRAGTLGGSR